MAILVAVAGAGLGAATGIGGSLGWTLGSLLGNLLFPPKGATQEGPRLGDLSVSSSAYGNPIPLGWGTVRTSGNIIWSSGIKETRHKKKSGGKGGGPKQTTITYTYSASFAIAFCEGVADDVLRIWADGKVIFDKRGTGTNTRKKGLKFTFYKGTEDQLPDPLIVADKGENRTPAFRGLCYMVFDELQLADFGNRIPNITVELTFAQTVNRVFIPGDPWTVGEGGASSSFQNRQLAIDWQRGFLYAQTSSPESGFRRFNLHTMKEDRQFFASEMMPDPGAGEDISLSYAYGIGPDGGLVCVSDDGGIGGNYLPISRFDPNTYKETARFGFNAVLGYPKTGPLTFKVATKFAFSRLWTLAGPKDYLIVGTAFGAIGILNYPDMTFLWSSETMAASWGDGSGWQGAVKGIVKGGEFEGLGESFVLGVNSGVWTIYQITIDASAEYSSVDNTTTGVRMEEVFSIPAATLLPGATTLMNGGNLVYDEVDGGLIFFMDYLRDDFPRTILAVKVRNGQIVWQTEIPYFPPDNRDFGGSNWYTQSRVKDGTLGWIRSDRPTLLDTASGELIEDGSLPAYAAPSNALAGAGFYDSETESYIGLNGSTIVGRWFFRRGGGQAANVATIVEDICGRVGLPPVDLELSDLADDTVPGYIIGAQSSARNAINPLATAFFFDGVESDYLLKFVQRGRAPVRILTQDELADQRNQEIVKESRQQEVELPERLSVLYMDQATDYQQGTQSAKRLRNPVPSMFSRNSISAAFPAVFDTDFAKQLAEKMMYSSWVERTSYELSTTWAHMALDPTDVVNVILDNGAVFRMRLAQVEVGASFEMSVAGISERPAQYQSTVQGSHGDGPLIRPIPGDVRTELILLDTPLLRDSDEPAGRASIPMYYFMGAYGQNNWNSGLLFKSLENTNYLQIGQAVSPMTFGVATTVLADPAFDNPWAPDELNSVTIAFSSENDQIESVTDLELVNGANAGALIKANGEIEIFQWRDVTVNPNGTLTLSYLLRGRRGTDTMAYGHGPSEIFVLLDPNDGDVFALALAERNLPRYYKAVTSGEFLDDATTTIKASQGRALMPYAPVHQKAVANGADVDISWIRRTRVGGGLQNGTSVIPLNEDAELYDLEILDETGDVVRTENGLTAPFYKYLEADQISDGFTTPMTSVTIRVYQVSAQVGRGFTKEITLNVE